MLLLSRAAALLVSCVVLAAAIPDSGWRRPAATTAPLLLPPVPVWPLPRAATAGGASATIAPEQFALGAATPSAALDAALERFRERAFPHPGAPSAAAPLEQRQTTAAAALTGLTVAVSDSTAALTLGVNESYTLVVPVSGNVTISAATVFGAFHGLETLSQLIRFSFSTERYQISDLLPLRIVDEPQFVHRGLLLDTARHFQPVASLMRVIDSMAMAKLNVLHLHMSEDQSFPAPSRIHPELPEQGAWSPSERYTWRELRSLVEFGRARGVRVIPELDMPGHATSWRASHPELFSHGASAASCGTQVDGAAPNVTRGALDPATNATFDFIEELLRDYYAEEGGAFTDDFVHLGADEVPTGCWDNPVDAAFIKAQGLAGGTAGLFSYFIERVHEIASSKLGRRVIMWDAAFNKGSSPPPKSVVIQMWLQYNGGAPNTLLQEIVRAGYHAIASPDVPWCKSVFHQAKLQIVSDCPCSHSVATLLISHPFGRPVCLCLSTHRRLERCRAEGRKMQHRLAVPIQLRSNSRPEPRRGCVSPRWRGLPVGRDSRQLRHREHALATLGCYRRAPVERRPTPGSCSRWKRCCYY
jgi:hexosaminidase